MIDPSEVSVKLGAAFELDHLALAVRSNEEHQGVFDSGSQMCEGGESKEDSRLCFNRLFALADWSRLKDVDVVPGKSPFDFLWFSKHGFDSSAHD